MLNEHPLVFRNLSAKAEYALLALIELATVYPRNLPLTVNEISNRQPIPDRYLEHIFTLLRRGGLVQSQRGAKGGYILTREPWLIPVSEVIALMDGENSKRRNANPNENGGPVNIERDILQEIWKQAGLASQEVLSCYTLQDICERRDACKQQEPMYYI